MMVRCCIFIGTLALVFGTGCRTEPVTWRVPMQDVLFLQDTLSWSHLVPDTVWEEGEDGIRLSVEATRALFDAEALMPNLDTAWTESFTLPFIGGPIPVPPGTPIWQDEENVSLNLPGIGLRRVRLGSGAMRLQVSSSVQGPLDVRYELVGAQFPQQTNGEGAVIELVVDADTAEVNLDLEGVVLDLDGLDGLEIGKLATSWSIRVPENASEPVGVLGSDSFALTVEFEGLEVAQVEGQFDAQLLTVADTMALEELAALPQMEFGWAGMDIDLKVRNTTGLDMMTTFHAIQRIDSTEDDAHSMSLVDGAIGSPVWLARAGLAGEAQMDEWQLTPTEAAFSFSSDFGNLAEFLASVPDALAWDFTLEVNPMGDVSGGFDRVDLTRLPEVDLRVSAPLSLSSGRLIWVDTLEILPPDWLDYEGFLDFEVESTLPVGATIRSELVDLTSSSSLLDSAFGPDWWKLDDLVVQPGNWNSDAPVTGVTSMDLMQPHFQALRDGARIRAEVELEIPDGGAEFRTDQHVVLRGLLRGNAQISVE